MKNSAKKIQRRSDIQTKTDLVKDGESVSIKQSVWTESIGWLTQKTLRLEEEDVISLRQSLEEAERQIKAKKLARKAESNLIQFPTK